MRVCVLSTKIYTADNEYLRKLLRSLQERFGEGQVSVICPVQEFIGSIEGAPVIRLTPRKGRNWLGRRLLQYDLLRYALRMDTQAFHAVGLDAARVAALCTKRRGGHVVYDCHEEIPYKAPDGQRGRLFEARRERGVARRADCIIAPDAFGEAYFRIVCGKNVYVWEVGDYPSEDILPAKESIVNIPPLMVYFGNLDYAHSLREILEALHILRQRGVRFHFRLIGDMPERERKYLREYARLQSLEDMLEIPDKYNAEGYEKALAEGDVGIIAHADKRMEHTAPGALFDYMHYGMAVVAPEYPTIAGVIEESGCGYLIDPKNAQDIANRLQTLLEDPNMREHMGRHGQRAIEDKYYWEAAEQVLFSAYAGMGME